MLHACTAQVSSQEARGNREYRETPWVGSDEALEAADSQAVGAPAAPGAWAGAASGSVRRVGSSAAGMGIKVRCPDLLARHLQLAC